MALTGEIKSVQTWYPGQHQPIVSAELWAQAQALLSLRRRVRKAVINKPQALLLKGLVFGTDGRAYSPCRSSLQNGRSYSYYVPQRKLAEGARATDLPRCPAGELDAVVVEHVRKTLRNPGSLLDALPAAVRQHQGYSVDSATAALASLDGIWDELFYPFVRTLLVHQLVERITIGPTSIKFALSLEGFGKAVLSLLPGGQSAPVGSGHQNALLHEPPLAKYGQKITNIRKARPPDLGRISQEVVRKIGFEGRSSRRAGYQVLQKGIQKFCDCLDALPSVMNHGPDGLARVHEIKCAVDFGQRHGVRDEGRQLDTPSHGVVHHTRQLRSALDSAERRAHPASTGDELKWPGGDFLPGAGHADDDRLTPSAVRTFQRCAHDLHIADAFKAVVNTPTRHLDDNLLDGLLMVLRVNTVRSTKDTR